MQQAPPTLVPLAVGRGSELTAVIDLVTGATSSRPVGVVVGGPRGIGRSRFMDGVAEALASRFVTRSVSSTNGAVDGWLDSVVAWSGSPPGAASGRTLLVDDVHLAHPSEQGALADVASAGDGPEAVVLSIPAGTRCSVPEVLRANGRDVRVLELAPLDVGDITLRLGRDRSDPEIQLLHAMSGGNPAVLAALGLGADGDRPYDPAGRLADLAATWTAGMSEVELLVLRSAAVLGPCFDLDVVSAVSRLEVGETAAALDRLVGFRFVTGRAEVPRFAHRHPALVEHYLAGADVRWRRGAHGRAATALEAAGASSATLVRHRVGRAASGDEVAIAQLLEETDPMTGGSGESQHVEVLAGLASLLPNDDPRYVDAMLALARSHAAAGDLAGWRLTLGELEELPGIDLPAEVIAELVEVELLAGDIAKATETLDRRLARAEHESDLDGRAVLLATRAACALYRGYQFGEARRQAEEAQRAIGTGATLAAQAAVAGAVAWCAALGGDDDLDVLVDRAIDLVDSLTEADLAESVLGTHLVAQAALSGQRLAESEAVALRIRAAAVATGQRHLLPFIDLTLARAQLFQGRLDEAGGVLDDAVGRLRVGRGGLHLAFGRATLAYVDAMQGDHDAARRGVNETLGLLLSEPESLLRSGAFIFVAHTLATVGAQARAADALLEGGGGPQLMLLPAVDRAYGYEILSAAAIEAGELGLARRWVEHARAAGVGPMATAAAERAAAHLAAAEGDHRSAWAAARRAREASDTAGGRLESARARLLEGLARSAGGERDPALIELLWVHRTCAELGASTFGAAAGRQLRRLGRRAPALADRGPLSDREAEVGALVASGLTNREIGTALFISERTVESHVANVFAKLGVRTRVGLAAVLSPATECGIDSSDASPPDVAALLRPLAAPDADPGPATRIVTARRKAAALAGADERSGGQADRRSDGEPDERSDERATLLSGSAPAGDAEAIEAVVAAAERASARGSVDEATHWWGAAATLLAEADAFRRIPIWSGWARSLERAGSCEAAHDVVGQLVDLIPLADPEAIAGAVDWHERLRHLLGLSLAEGQDLPQPTSERPGPNGLAQVVLRARLRRAFLGSDAAQAIEPTPIGRGPTRSSVPARPPVAEVGLDPTSSCLAALVALLGDHALPLDPSPGLEEVAAQLLGRHVDPSDSDPSGGRGEGLALLAWWAHLGGRTDLVVAAAAALTDPTSDRPGPWELPGRMIQLVSMLRDGATVETAAAADRLLHLARVVVEPLPRLMALGGACMAAALVDDHSRAIALADELSVLADSVTPSPWRAWALSQAATGHLLSGRPALATAALVSGGGGERLPLMVYPDRGRCFELLVQADLAAGDRAGAEARADLADAIAGGPSTVSARRRRAAIALDEGDLGRARWLLGLRDDERLSALDHLIERRLLDSTWEADVDPDGSPSEHPDWEDGPCSPDADGMVQDGTESRPSSRRFRRTSVGDRRVPELTARQTQVAELVASGLSNRQIAGVLSVSEKTVEGHVSNVLQRLGVRSRVRIGAALRAPDDQVESTPRP